MIFGSVSGPLENGYSSQNYGLSTTRFYKCNHSGVQVVNLIATAIHSTSNNRLRGGLASTALGHFLGFCHFSVFVSSFPGQPLPALNPNHHRIRHIRPRVISTCAPVVFSLHAPPGFTEIEFRNRILGHVSTSHGLRSWIFK